MSVVACRITENGYEIAADSITVRGWTQTRGQNAKLVKLFETNGMIIGGVGMAEELSLFRLFVETRRPGAPTNYAILEFISEFSEWKEKRIGTAGVENAYLFGFENKVFTIEGWLVAEVSKYEAIGAGMDYALSALYLGHSARRAVEVAIELSVFCESPVIEFSKTL